MRARAPSFRARRANINRLTGANADPNNSFREASTPWFSMLNTGDPGTATGTIDAYKEALGLLFSMQNLAKK